MNPRLRAGIIYAAFLLTGVGTAVLGASLPAMLREWMLSDRTGGLLLFCSFAGSTAGVLLAGIAPGVMTGVGMSASAIAAVLLSLPSSALLAPLFLLYGIGLGTTMTSISLLRSREVPAPETTLELSRLNLIWATGACFAPILALHSVRLFSVGALFTTLSLAFALAAISLLLANFRSTGVNRAAPAPLPRLDRLAPVRMCIFAGAAVGLESALGSWLTAYTQRRGHSAGIAATANSAFWVGLLLSRAAHSVRAGRRLQSPVGFLAHLAAITLALLLLVGTPLEALLPVSAFLAGFGLGPLYPLVLSWALPRYRSSAVFMLAGAGAAVLPWLTGVLSTAFGSLRAGLLAPCATVLVLLGAAVSLRREVMAPAESPA